MSNEDSFLNEVSDEVRRDRLFAVMKRYGWIAVLLIFVIVGGAAYNEWRKAQARSAAEARGNAILAALEADDPATSAAALSAIEGEGATAAVVAMLSAAQAEDAEESGTARDRLEAIVADPEIPQIYRDLATIKVLSLRGGEMTPDDRIERLTPLTQAGAPYRPLALELTALAHVEAGNREEALKILTDLVSDSQATLGLRNRVSQLIVALGGEIGAG